MGKPYIVDGHCDSLIHFVNGERTLHDPLEGGHWDIQRARLSRCISSVYGRLY